MGSIELCPYLFEIRVKCAETREAEREKAKICYILEIITNIIKKKAIYIFTDLDVREDHS